MSGANKFLIKPDFNLKLRRQLLINKMQRKRIIITLRYFIRSIGFLSIPGNSHLDPQSDDSLQTYQFEVLFMPCILFLILFYKNQYIYYATMDSYLETDLKINFKKGMTLSEYMHDMDSEDNQLTQEEQQLNADDLYATCIIKQKRSPSTKIIPFNIPEMDEDNYESSVDFTPQTPLYQPAFQNIPREKSTLQAKQKTNKKNQIQITTMYSTKQKQKTDSAFEKQSKKQYRVKHQSNSPFKREPQLTPTKNNLSKTLYGNTFLSNNLSNMSTASSTLYQNKLAKLNKKSALNQNQPQLKGTIHSREFKNEKYFHQKNKRDIDNIIEYENNMRMKYSQKINIVDIRVEGFKDKMYERKNKIWG